MIIFNRALIAVNAHFVCTFVNMFVIHMQVYVVVPTKLH